MRDVYLWTAYVVGSGAVGVAIRFVVGRLLDERRERRYVPPAKLYTEVHVSKAGWVVPEDPEQPSLSPDEVLDVFASSWALDALSDVRKAADEDDYATLGEFAGRVASAPALIWADMVGRRTVLGLVTA